MTTKLGSLLLLLWSTDSTLASYICGAYPNQYHSDKPCSLHQHENRSPAFYQNPSPFRIVFSNANSYSRNINMNPSQSRSYPTWTNFGSHQPSAPTYSGNRITTGNNYLLPVVANSQVTRQFTVTFGNDLLKSQTSLGGPNSVVAPNPPKVVFGKYGSYLTSPIMNPNPVAINQNQNSPTNAKVCASGGRFLGTSCSNSLECWATDPFSECQNGICCTVPGLSEVVRSSRRIRMAPFQDISTMYYNHDLEEACFGEPAISSCLDSLCPVGYHCTRRGYCCPCPRNKSRGSCIIQLPYFSSDQCPVGYTCDPKTLSCCEREAREAVQRCVGTKCPLGSSCDRIVGICDKRS